MNAGKITGANFVDLLKSFDTLSNSQTIYRLPTQWKTTS